MLCELQLYSILLCWKRKKENALGKREIAVPELVLHINAFQFFPQLQNSHGITYKHIILYLVP